MMPDWAEELEIDLQWREAELASLKLLAVRADDRTVEQQALPENRVIDVSQNPSNELPVKSRKPANMHPHFILNKPQNPSEIDELLNVAQTLETDGQQAQAIQAYDTILCVDSEQSLRARANLQLAKIYREWGEQFAAHRLLRIAQELDPTSLEIIDLLTEFNAQLAENQARMAAEKARKNSDQIVSLFRVATGIKLIQMEKRTEAYPRMRSRTKIYPNAAVAKHLLTDVLITAEDKNSAIEFLEERGWLVNTRSQLYSITETGLYTFYLELAKLHVANEVYDEGAKCFGQAYWLSDSESAPLYHKVICDAKSEAWGDGLATHKQLTNDPPDEVDKADYHAAVAQTYAQTFQSTQDPATGQRAIEACETALKFDKRNRDISRLLKLLQATELLQSDSEPEHKPQKRRWWQR